MKNWLLKILIVAVAITSFVGCKRDEATADISGNFAGFAGKKVCLELYTDTGAEVVDSATLDANGYYRFELKDAAETPTLYYLVCEGYRIPLLVSRNESVTLSSEGNLLENYTVSGSHESELLRKFNKEYNQHRKELETILTALKGADKTKQEELLKQYQACYNGLKRKQIAFVIENKESMAALCVLYQRLPNEPTLSGSDVSDVIQYRTVLEAVSQSYPNAPLVQRLKSDVERMEARIALLNSVEERSYPELKGPDMFGREQSLSSLEGNVILVDFWSAEAGNSNAFNADLKALYEQYKSKGFRVYQVSADSSKAIWITAVQEQHLPWVSVCDFRGGASPMLMSYNVRSVPSNFLIDRNGDIVAKNLYGEELEKMLAKMFK